MMYTQDLEMLRETRAETLRLLSGLSQAQSEVAPAPGKWSAGEVADHLLMAEKFFRSIFERLIDLRKSGQKAVITSGFEEIDSTLSFIPASALPLLEVPFTVFNLFVPTVVRETMTQFRILPARNSSRGKPQRGCPIDDLRESLKASYAQTAALFHSNPGLNYRAMRYRHPMLGFNNALQILRTVSFHERRHQSQIRDILRSSSFARVA